MEGSKPIFGNFSFIVILNALLIIVWISGRKKQVQHIKRVNKVPIRIHVNGIRGKSTVTRLIGGALRESGLKNMTKTTGKGLKNE